MSDPHKSVSSSRRPEKIPQGFSIARAAFSDLLGWAEADHEVALSVFSTTVHHARSSDRVGPTRSDDWQEVASAIWAADGALAREFFEEHFTPVRVTDGRSALFTGYYEPILRASRYRDGTYQFPIYGRPPDLGSAPYLTRAEINAGGLSGRGLELFWTDDPISAFFLEIQGSGRIELPDGSLTRVGFAAKNNHSYRAIGKILVDRGEMDLADVTAQSLKDFLRADRVRGMALMDENPSYVFFTERRELDADTGPIGAMGLPVSAGYTVAVDPTIHPLGAPVWIEADQVDGYGARLMVAQDVGGAIKGAQRADLFIGSGEMAGQIAGGLRATGRLITLLPNAAAARIVSG